MAFRLDDRWIWDFWFAQDDDGLVHVFYLFAPKSLGHPELRHQSARIGHAVSSDLVSWSDLGPALPPAPAGAGDDRASWTGSIVRDHDGTWRMYYSGISERENGRFQRVVLATSADLLHWERADLCLEADRRWYEPQDFRDPWVLWDAEARLWRMYVCARSRSGPPDGRGAIALLTSTDLRTWEPGPPVTVPGEFRQMEVPQIVPAGRRLALLFCLGDTDHSAVRLGRGVAREYGTHAMYGDRLGGPFTLHGDAFLSGDNGPSLYAGRAVRHADRWWFVAWDRVDASGDFVGALSDPYPLAVVDDTLLVDFGAPRRTPMT